MSSIAVTATTAAVLFGNAFLLPPTFTQSFGPDDPELPLPPTYSSSASAPSLSESLNRTRGLDFFRLMAEDGEEEEEAATVVLMVLVEDEEAVEPVVRVGGPGEYIAAADPGRE